MTIHIALKYHWFKQYEKSGLFDVLFINTKGKGGEVISGGEKVEKIIFNMTKIRHKTNHLPLSLSQLHKQRELKERMQEINESPCE